CLPEQGPAVGGTGTPSSVKATSSRTSVEEYRANDENQGRAGKALESFYAHALNALPPGGKLELSTQGRVGLEAAGEVKAKVEVERGEDGSYQVTVRGGLGGGVAASSGAKGAKGSAMLGMQGAVTLRFESAAEAADRLAALAQAEVMSLAGLGGKAAVALGLLDSDSIERALQVQKNVKSFEVGLYAELKGELELTALKVGAALVGEGTFRVDVKEGKLVYESSLQVQLQGELQGGFEGLGGGLESRVLLRAEVALTKEELARLKDGKLEPRELMKPERLRKSLTQEVKGELSGGSTLKSGVSINAKRELPLESLGDVARVMNPLGDWEVSAMRKTSLAQETLDASVVELKAEASVEQPLFDKPRTMPLGAVRAFVHQAEVRSQSTEHLLLARRALGR
ncbi:MAG TPA: hypothetical protein VF794_36215, partial [Archangium sp.]|uniref:hypothetical protein n=1 Tax=Archangium sp. TaxID=1872627 RepID=UPI002ED98F4D